MKQGSLFDDLVSTRDEWRLHWRGMPAFVQEDLAPAATTVYPIPGDPLYVHHPRKKDAEEWRRKVHAALREHPGKRPEDLGRAWLSGLVGYEISEREDLTKPRGRTQAVWFPDPGSRGYVGKEYVNLARLKPGDKVVRKPDGEVPIPFEQADWAGTPRGTVPRHPVYVISKGRWDPEWHDTATALERAQVPFRIVVEPQERDLYARRIPAERILVLPFSNLGLGSIPARNWVWEHALQEGRSAWHWILDDNIQGFYRLHYNLKTPCADGTIFRAAEDFVDRYVNVAKFGFNYFMFASQDTVLPPYVLNTRVYSCICLRNDLPYRWRGRYNEDTDLSLRILKDGHATILFSAFLARKAPTLTMKGGNTDQLYAGVDETLAEWEKHAKTCATCGAERPWLCEEACRILEPDGRWRMALSLQKQHPERTTIARKWGRWQHSVDYSDFTQKLIPKLGAIPAEGDDDYGMVLRIRTAEPKAAEPKAAEPKAAELAPQHPFIPDVLTTCGGIRTASVHPFVFPDRPGGPAPKTQTTFEAGASRAAIPKDWQPDAFPDLSRVDGPIGFDTETSGLRWWAGDRVAGTSLSWWEGRTLRSVYLPVRHREGNHDPERFLEWARSPEGLRGRQLVGLNVKFDAHQERESGLDLEALGCRLSDIGHRQAIIDNRTRAFKLDSIAKITLGEDQGKVEGVDVSRGAHIYHAAEVAAYARRDAELPLLILANQIPRIEADGLGRVVDLEDEVQWAVIEMERNGMLLDMERLAALQKQAKQAHEAALFQLAAVAGFACNPSSADDMERLFRARGIEIRERTEKTGRISLAEGALDGIDDPSIALARRCHILGGIRSRYLDAYPRLVSPGGILRYSLHQLRGDDGGTISGRFSCSQAIRDEEGANLQQVITAEKLHDQGIEEYDIRRLFVAPRGRVVVAGDAKQIEYRVFAHYTENPALLAAYKDEPDARRLRQLREKWEAEGASGAEIDRRTKALTVDFHEWVGTAVRKHRPDFGRKRIKVINFMVLFGGGIKKICEMLGVSQKEGKALKDIYDRTFPDGKRLLHLASDLAENRRWVSTYIGRRARFGPNDRYHKALNSVIQGTAADYNKVKLAALYKARRDFDLTLRLTVHDEVVGDVPNINAANAMAEFLDRQEWPEFRVPILWSVGTGASWGEAK